MMSVRLMSLFTDVSVLGERIRQIYLYDRAPDQRKASSSHIGCDYIQNHQNLEDFMQ